MFTYRDILQGMVHGNMGYILAFIGILALFWYLQSPAFKGAVGEKRVNSSLKSNLNAQEYYLLADLTLPTTNGTTQVDHIVLAQSGIFVIETKNMSGWIFGSADQARWTQVLRRHKSQFQNPLRQNYKHIKVIQSLLGIEFCQLHNLVVFVGPAKPKTKMPPNVLWGLRGLPNYIRSTQPEYFSDSQLQHFRTTLLSNALEANRETKRAHIKHVKTNATRQKNDKSKCPRCSAQMIERTNKKTGEKFFGCSRFPKCRGMRQVEK